MKIKSLLIGMLACTALVGCTSDDVVENNEQPVLKGDKAYMVINIMSGDDLSSRGSAPTDKPLQLGTASEHKVATADFYFYDESGNYVTKASAWNGGTATPNEGDEVAESAANHIEFKSNTIIVLQNLTGKANPKYVVAVLNAPEGFTLGNTLAQAQAKLIGYKEGFGGSADLGVKGGIITSVASTTEGGNPENYFIMSNSTYNNGDVTSKFFATELDETNFSEEPIELNENGQYIGDCTPVQIYVERLAAKVQLDVNITGVTKADDGSYTVSLGSDFNIDGEGNKTLQAKVTGWGLNATNRNSYIMKNVPDWSAVLGFTWDAKDYHRSYWGLSHNYDKGTYPETFAAGQTGDNKGFDLSNTYTLDYITYNELSKKSGEVDYCAENTNSAGFLNGADNFHATVTEIILQAEVVDGEGNPFDLIRYDNMLYTQNGYFNRLFIKVNPQIYKMTGENTYTQITVSDVTGALADEGDGRVSVGFTLKAGTYYALDGSTYTVDANAQTTLTNLFTTHFNNEKEAGNLAKHYNAGKMYYNIPIEHLRTQTDGSPYDENSKISVLEAEYGVVRNHYYKITVSSISQLGTAVHDPDEEIVPNPGENITYYVGAQINILSWKIVNQTANL